jgi:hypothetical protein
MSGASRFGQHRFPAEARPGGRATIEARVVDEPLSNLDAKLRVRTKSGSSTPPMAATSPLGSGYLWVSSSNV